MDAGRWFQILEVIGTTAAVVVLVEAAIIGFFFLLSHLVAAIDRLIS